MEEGNRNNKLQMMMTNSENPRNPKGAVMKSLDLLSVPEEPDEAEAPAGREAATDIPAVAKRPAAASELA